MPQHTIPDLLLAARRALAMQRTAISRLDRKCEARSANNAHFDTKEDPVHATLSVLLRYYIDRGDAVLSLLAIRCDWDAEILLRTCYECASKTLFIALSPRSNRPQLVWEFWVPLGEAADRKAARKAGYAETVFSDTDEDARSVFRLLQDPRMIRTRLPLSKKVRARLQQKWSFSELIESLAELELGGRKLAEARSLLHGYGMASHLAHADSRAMDLMTDRTLRNPDELRALQDGHAARIASDLISVGSFCIHTAYDALDTQDATLRDNQRQAEIVLAIATEIGNTFYDSQRSFYESLRPTRNQSE